jgi:hypothetical protein
MGLGFGLASDQLSAQPHNSRSNSEKKTSHNIEQHLYGFDIDKESNSGPQRVSTLNLWCQRFHCTNDVLKNCHWRKEVKFLVRSLQNKIDTQSTWSSSQFSSSWPDTRKYSVFNRMMTSFNVYGEGGNLFFNNTSEVPLLPTCSKNLGSIGWLLWRL